MAREALTTAAQTLSPSLPSAIALPAGAPWPAIAVLGALGLIASTLLAIMRERHRHAETLLTLTGADRGRTRITAEVTSE